MTIYEFIRELREALEGEVPESEIRSNIRYYEEYMNNERITKSEEEITAALGEPRLIARTIIDTFQMQHGGETHYDRQEANYYQEAGREYRQSSYNNGTYTDGEVHTQESYSNRAHKSGNHVRVLNMPGWLASVLGIMILVLIFSALFWIGGVVLKLFIRFGLPILLVVLIVTFIRNRR
ncbi:MAG: hypothetical protein E7256_01075 [Lachnospiraceae bacterium]|nr:hypothetical protein [Lachnospiraceae bacterium]